MPGTLAIVVNWNKRDMLDRMLASLRAGGRTDFDTVVVDNASTDASVEMLREKHPWVEVIENAENLGGTGGFNRGMRYGLASPKAYDFFWLLDNDTLIHEGAFDALMRAMESDPRIGIVGSAILLMDDPSMVQEAGAHITWTTGGIWREGEGATDKLPKAKVYDVDYVAACSLLARVKAVREVGLWDPAYFFIWDDMEWGVRFNRAGWRVVAATDSLVRHESYDNRRGRNAAAGNYQNFRNGFYFFHRYCPPRYKAAFFFHQLRYVLTHAENYEAAGLAVDAKAMRMAVDDFFDERMGPAPKELYVRSLPIPAAEELPTDKRKPIRRIAVLTRDNAPFARAVYERLTQEFPQAEIDTVVLCDNTEILREELPRRKLLKMDSFPQRLALAIRLPMEYDAVASPVFLQHFFFERCVKMRIRFREDLTWEARPRDLGEIFALGWRRLLVLWKSAFFTLRALLREPHKVDYFDFEDRGYTIHKFAPGAIWTDYQRPERRDEKAEGIGWKILSVLLFPISLLTMLLAIMTVPLLCLADRARGRK